MIIKLDFKKDDDGSGCGILTITFDGYPFAYIPITHTRQLEIMDKIIGEYRKI